MYHIFEVFDYKGGELSTDLNLDKEDFIQELTEKVYNHVEEWPDNVEEIKISLKEVLTVKENGNDFLNIYAGGDGFCGNLYVTNMEDGYLNEVEWTDFIDEISDKILEWKNDDQ